MNKPFYVVSTKEQGYHKINNKNEASKLAIILLAIPNGITVDLYDIGYLGYVSTILLTDIKEEEIHRKSLG